MTKDANPALSASAGSPLYKGITLNIVPDNARSGDRIMITLRGRGGSHISWSTGPESSHSAGIRLRGSSSGAVPISDFSVSGEVVTLLLAPSDSGGTTPFTLMLYLAAAQNIREFTLSMSSDARSSVSATLPASQPTQLGSSPIIFDWNPY